MNTRRFAITILLAVFLCGLAFAGDDIQSSVTGVTPAAIVTPNGQGAISPGTIQILYTVVANQFTAGAFGSFTLNLQDVQANTNGKLPSYPVTLTLVQNGSTQVTLTPNSSTLGPVGGPGWAGSTLVNISIPQSVIDDSSNTADGTTLVGNLNVSASDSHLGTNTTVQVKIKLSVPQASTCLNAYHFATDQDFTQTLTTIPVNQNKKGFVVATNPGQLSDNTLVVNTCGTTENFDVKVALDARWATNPNNNPGNAVFTFNTTGEIDETTFNIASFGLGTPQGQNLCIQNISVAPGDTFLMTVHMGIITGVSGSSLGTNPFSFSSAFTAANSSCNGTADPLVAPNPAIYSLPFTLY